MFYKDCFALEYFLYDANNLNKFTIYVRCNETLMVRAIMMNMKPINYALAIIIYRSTQLKQ